MLLATGDGVALDGVAQISDRGLEGLDNPVRAGGFGAASRRVGAILLVALVTVIALLAVSEGAARLVFRSSPRSAMACLVATDPRTGVRGIPGSFCQEKDFETPLVDYRFNDCGFRTPQPCRPAPAGVYRIVLIGTSITFGLHVEQSQSFAGRLGPILSQRLHRPVETFNEAMLWGTPASLKLRTEAMLQPRPAMILWTLSPHDFENARVLLPYLTHIQPEILAPLPVVAGSAPKPANTAPRLSQSSPGLAGQAWHQLITAVTNTRMVFAAQHYLYRSQSQYMAHTLTKTDVGDYLRVPPSPELRENLAVFADAFTSIAARAKAAGVPLVVTLLPSRAQAIMLSNQAWGKGYDPNQLGRLVRGIVEAGGGRYVDAMPGLEAMPEAGQHYFSVDEHPTVEGHRMFATLLANALLRSRVIAPVGNGKP